MYLFADYVHIYKYYSESLKDTLLTFWTSFLTSSLE